mmetsp:Transcript_64367/g.176690  ORF Transcript_64367/g.176690 Transcript_64367/m.176690 type:complete len:289 (+) Transcript_64367:233-1099(+)
MYLMPSITTACVGRHFHDRARPGRPLVRLCSRGVRRLEHPHERLEVVRQPRDLHVGHAPHQPHEFRLLGACAPPSQRRLWQRLVRVVVRIVRPREAAAVRRVLARVQPRWAIAGIAAVCRRSRCTAPHDQVLTEAARHVGRAVTVAAQVDDGTTHLVRVSVADAGRARARRASVSRCRCGVASSEEAPLRPRATRPLAACGRPATRRPGLARSQGRISTRARARVPHACRTHVVRAAVRLWRRWRGHPTKPQKSSSPPSTPSPPRRLTLSVTSESSVCMSSPGCPPSS